MRKNRIVLSILVLFLLVSCAPKDLVSLSYEAFDKTVTIDRSFKNYTDRMNTVAGKHSIIVKVQESFRRKGTEVTNAIVPPVQTSNHLVGHAIDINLLYNSNLYNSKDLGDYENLPFEIKKFIDGCKKLGLRWGGDFVEPDGVHFDDNLYELDRRTYEMLYRRYQE